MKLYLLLFVFSFFAFNAQAQTTTTVVDEYPFDTYHKNVYVEGLGSSILVGASYDMRLNRGQMDGIGFRVGVGGLSASGYDYESRSSVDIGIVTFPLEFNNLVGSRRSSFISGVGLLPAYVSLDADNISVDGELFDFEGDGLTFAGGYLNIGYRFQPLTNGIMFQIAWNPMILRGSGFDPLWFNVGLGFGFK